MTKYHGGSPWQVLGPDLGACGKEVRVCWRGAKGVRERHAGGGGRGAGQHSRICNKHVLVVQDLVCFASTD